VRASDHAQRPAAAPTHDGGKVVATTTDDPRWDAFVRSRPEAVAYHLAGWMRVLEGAYRARPLPLVLEDGRGELLGVLPLVQGRGPLSGRRMRSLPVVPTAGPLASTPEGAVRLIEAACDLAVERGKVLTVDSRAGGLETLGDRLATTPKAPSWVLELPQDDASHAAWLKGRSSNLRRGIKRAERDGVKVRVGDRPGDLEGFHRLYLATMRKHRAVPRTLRQLRLARAHLPGVFTLLVAEYEGRLVAGGVWHVLGDTVELLYNASDPDALPHRPNHALYHWTMRWGAGELGLRRLDFGFAWPGALADFKASWGAEPVAEHRYVDARAGAPPEEVGGRVYATVGDPERPSLLQRAWERAPLPLTAAAGSVAYRWL